MSCEADTERARYRGQIHDDERREIREAFACVSPETLEALREIAATMLERPRRRPSRGEA